MNDSNLLSTKFMYAILITILGFALTVTGKVPAETFFTFCEVVGATYVIGNVASKFAPEAKQQ